MKTMRSQRVVLPLALQLLSAAFMLACQEQASSPVGPEGLGILLDKEGLDHTHGGGGGGPAAAMLDLAGLYGASCVTPLHGRIEVGEFQGVKPLRGGRFSDSYYPRGSPRSS
jgi:hypothetical protein